MNGFMGTRTHMRAIGSQSVFFKFNDLVAGPRAEYLVFLDTHDDYQSYCSFSLTRDIHRQTWERLPTSRHSQRGTLSFHDGHVELHRWQDSVLERPVRGVQALQHLGTGSRDWDYVWRRMTIESKDFGDPGG
jgi:prepilin-type processing-associated H-X9-DG protein